MVRCVKRCLKKILKNAKLTYEELLTVVVAFVLRFLHNLKSPKKSQVKLKFSPGDSVM